MDKGGNKAIIIADEYNDPWQPPYKPQIGVKNNGCPISFNSKPTSVNSGQMSQGYSFLESVFGDYKNGYKNCYIKPKPVEDKKMSQRDLARQGLGRFGEGLVRTVFGGVSTAAGVGTVAGGNPMGIPAIVGGVTQVVVGLGKMIGGLVDIWHVFKNETDKKGLDPIRDILFKDHRDIYNAIDFVSTITTIFGAYKVVEYIVSHPEIFPALAIRFHGVVNWFFGIQSSSGYSGTRNPDADFKNGTKLTDHFNNYGKDFGYTSEQQYLKGANDFLMGEMTNTTQSFTTESGTYFRYDAATNTFGIINEYGGVSTYFKPTEGLVYWQKQMQLYKP